MAKQFECFQEGCNFMILADTEEELITLVQKHARDRHGMEIEADDIRPEIEDV